MFRILKLFVGVAAVIAFVWFGANVSLGPRTLFEHLQAIGRTREADALFDGARRSAEPLIDDVRKRWNASGSVINGSASGQGRSTDTLAHAVDAGAAPAEHVSEADRLRLRRLLEARHPSR